MAKGMIPEKDEIQPEQQTLRQDEMIEWILQNTEEDTEFRVHQSKHYTLVGIDTDKDKEPA